ncbi:nuclear transport factor 2 family protein [Acidovorax sp. DW039]|uniref:hypothetical protein n=1 Tax=Acidovorax sp. DW039 TaxID=3095606 RepID=UPI0030879BDD|nr:nuclear transport factor 2 family protein [Acidovorax sp. DW039]
MSKVLVFLVVGAAAAGGWYGAVGGKKVTQAHVQSLYHDYMSAFDRGDGIAVCDLFSADVRGKFKSTSRTMPVNEVVSKASSCAAVDNFLASKAKLEQATGRELHTNVGYTIHNITIAPDGKSATAEVLLEFRIGTAEGALLDMRSTQVDVIKRNWGKSQFVQSDGSVSFFR